MKKLKLENNSISIANKKKKNFIIFLIIIVITTGLVLSFINFYQMSTKDIKAKKIEREKENKEQALIDKTEFKESWAIGMENKFKSVDKKLENTLKNQQQKIQETFNKQQQQMQSVLEEMKNFMKEQQQQTEKTKEELESKIKNLEEKTKEEIEAAKVKSSQGSMLPPPPSTGSKSNQSELLPPLNNKKTNGNESLLPPLPGVSKGSQKSAAKKEEPRNVVITDFVNHAVIKKVKTDKENIEKQKKLDAKKPEKTYDVAMGFTKAYMITGAYAPVMGGKNINTIPVLLEAEGDIIIANDETESIDKCFLIGSAIGNVSSETIDIRISKLECILNNGTGKIRGAIKGWVIGENGKPGVSAQLISKSGAYISRTILAGVMQGFSQALVNTTQKSQSTGSNINLLTNGTLQGAAQGTQDAFSMLADYYMKKAEETLPILEAQGGRNVSIMLNGGEQLSLTKFNKIDTVSLDEYISENPEEDLK